jgi:glycosyltransferase involved in cell wall biosynthesis
VPRRILLLITDLQIGGTPTVVRELAIRLREPGRVEVEVACLAAKWGPVAGQLCAAGVEVTALGARGPTDFAVIRNLVDLIRRRRFDTVLSFLVHSNAVAAVASWFCSRDARFIQSIQTTQPWPRWHWFVQRVAQHFAEKLVVPSPSTARAARDWANVPAENIVVIPNAVCTTGFQHVDRARHGLEGAPAAIVSAAGTLARGTVNVGFVGRLDPVKRVTDLVRAMALLDARFVLHVFGDGEDRANVESEVARLGLHRRITLRGATAQPQVAIGQFDVLVLPSAAEGFGLVLIEAMAAGVPVVATDVPGIRDVVRDGVTGILVPVARPDELARAIRAITNSPELRDSLVRAALDDVRHRFTWDVVLPQYRRLLFPE